MKPAVIFLIPSTTSPSASVMRTMSAAIVCVALLSACAAPPQLTREEYFAATTRVYEGVTPEEVFKAAERLMRLADGDDFLITHYREGMRAARPRSAFLVIAAANGVDHGDVRATHVPG